MVASVGTRPKSRRTASKAAAPRPAPAASTLRIRLLGGVAVLRDGVALPLPASRKARALLGFLAMAPRPVGRSALCELLWDVPNDPRGELRWCLSKLRGVLDDDGPTRVIAEGDTVALALDNCFVDALAIEHAMQRHIETLDTTELRSLAALFAGEFMDGVEIDRQPLFDNWLIAQRRRIRGCQAAVLEQLVARLPADSPDVFDALDKWLQLAPLDARAHRAMLEALARHGRIRDGEEHLETTTRLFESEGLDVAPLRDAWRTARPQVVIPSAEPLVKATTRAAVPARRASIAVMPFVDRTPGAEAHGGGIAEGLAHDVITRLAKLRVLFVIAHGSVFALNERNVGPEEAGRMLNVDYVASGWVQRRPHGNDKSDRIVVTGELVETRSARIIWTDKFDYAARDALSALDDIGNNIVASIAHEIEVAERNRAILRPPSSLDAWEAYHRGLWHMYRFNAKDNDQAAHFLQMATRLDPTFSRAYSALSFTHFQNAFLHRLTNRQHEIERTYDTAGQSLIVDEQDPAAHWAMGRALWLRGLHDDAVLELERAVELSPNFAQGHYTLSFVHCQTGDPRAAIRSSDHSRELSPFDPLLFAMLATRALAHLRLGENDAAADWASKAVARPNAHAHIVAIAIHCLGAAGRLDEAHALWEQLRRRNPTYRMDEFLSSFHFAPDARALLEDGAKRLR